MTPNEGRMRKVQRFLRHPFRLGGHVFLFLGPDLRVCSFVGDVRLHQWDGAL